MGCVFGGEKVRVGDNSGEEVVCFSGRVVLNFYTIDSVGM